YTAWRKTAVAGCSIVISLFDKIVWDDPPPCLTALRRDRRNATCLVIVRVTASAGGTPGNQFPGGHRSRVTPVPIPNTEVKPTTADGTARAGVWESRSLPGLFFNTEGRIHTNAAFRV